MRRCPPQFGRALAALLMLGGASRAFAAPEDVRLIPSGGTGVHFVVQVPAAQFVATGTDEPVMRAIVDGYEPSGALGAPALPLRVITVAVPPVGEVRVRGAGADAVTSDGLLIAPTPRLVGKPGEEIERFDRSPAAYAARANPDAPSARLIGVTWIRNQRVARIAVTPATYDAAARRYVQWGSVDVSVEVTGASLAGLAAERVDPFESIYRELLVNYEQGRNWRATPPVGARAAVPRGFDPQHAMVAPIVPDTTLYVGRPWVKLAITQTGFYKVLFSQIRNTTLFGGATNTLADSMRLFTWPGVPVLPEDSYCDSCDYREVALGFNDVGQIGTFGDPNDAFYFFAMGPSDWSNLYDPQQGDSTFLDNPYETKTYYYLALATTAVPVPGPPKRIAVVSGAVSGGPTTTPVTFRERAHFEQDLEYFPHASPKRAGQDMFWEKWMWQSLQPAQSFIAPFALPGIDATQSLELRMRAWGVASEGGCTASIGQPSHLLDVALNGVGIDVLGWNQQTGATSEVVLASGFSSVGNQYRATVRAFANCGDRVDQSAIAWFEAYYARRFVAANSELTFESPAAPASYLFVVDSLQASLATTRVFDVTDAYAPAEVQLNATNFTDQGGGYFRLSFERALTERHRFRVVQDASVARLADANIADASAVGVATNLRSPTLGADYVVIYYDGFKAAADTLAAWRQTRLPIDGNPGPYATFTVPVSALFDQFSGGRTDPAALRNFLRAAFYNWQTRPTFVTFLGDASYDFKNLSGRAPAGVPGSLLPTYENGFDPTVEGGRQFATDDWIMNVDDAATIIPDFMGGRIPVDDAATAMAYIRNKLLFYERQAPLGEYRNRVLLIADDNIQAANPQGRDPLAWTHLDQTSQLDTTVTPRHVDRDYVYLHKYADGPGNTKPGAKDDIKKFLGEGVAMFNYIGHGSPFKIADEGVFLDVDTGTLTNATMLPIFVAASCDVGNYDNPALPSLGERLVTSSGGGAIGVISSTELAVSSQNAALNRTIYSVLFNRDSLSGTGQYHRGAAAGLLTAKLLGGQTTQKYQLMGDAAMQINFPKLWTEITLWDSAGTTPLTEARRGQTVMFKGRTVTRPGGAAVPFDGVAGLLIEDSAPREIAPVCTYDAGCYRPPYYYRPGPIFRGDVEVTAGLLQGRFVVPLEAALGARGRVRAYFHGRTTGQTVESDGVGAIDAQISPSNTVSSDTQGPRITLSFVGGATAVKPDAQLRADLFDVSGILLTGHSVQNGIVVTVDGNTTARVDITSSFRYAADSYQSGFAVFQLPNLAPGHHTVQVSAADNFAAGLNAGTHRSSALLEFDVVATPDLNVARAYLFPNPTSSGGANGGGTFVIDAPGDSVNVLLRIYTVTGHVIRSLTVPGGGLGQVQLRWDGIDDDGDRLANGVYLFKVYVYGRQADGSSSTSQKAISQGRFVIVNR